MWWIWALVLAFVLLVVEVVVGTIWLWRKAAALLSEVEHVTGRLDELAGILDDLDTTPGQE
ncbi:hypothetical protein O6R08_06225 [Cutibacterium equinum]|uniref:Uncharacterized protein n=1 Tax=Cutibacterium equinum TaxID=3016342 RepID=A0ABY7QXL9_9ACTN|nr:hypothetical protein [Cutibacterium equinum]WCC79154.1 hypothetical protein O6R08_06225 [Cutibacterium equinum]